MNQRIRSLVEQLGYGRERYNTAQEFEDFLERFAKLIVRECIRECSQEWYDLNNSSTENLDDRGIAIHVGQKAGVLKAQQRIKKHFGVE